MPPPLPLDSDRLTPVTSAAPGASSSSRSVDAPRDAPMFAGRRAGRALAALEDHLGKPIQALDVAVFPAYVRVQLQPPDDPRSVVTYEVRGDKISGPVPVQLSGEGGVSSSLFRVEADTFDEIDEMVATAERALGQAPDAGQPPTIEAARADYVSLARDLPFSRRLLFRVFVTGDTGSGYADFDPKGAFLKAEAGTPR